MALAGPDHRQEEAIVAVQAKPVVPKLTKEEFAAFRALLEEADAKRLAPAESEIEAVESAWSQSHPPLVDEAKKKPRASKELDPKLLEEFAKMGLKSEPLVKPTVWNMWKKTPKFEKELGSNIAKKRQDVEAKLKAYADRYAAEIISPLTAEQIAKDCIGEPGAPTPIVSQLQQSYRKKMNWAHSTPSSEQIKADCGRVDLDSDHQEKLEEILQGKKKCTPASGYKEVNSNPLRKAR